MQCVRPVPSRASPVFASGTRPRSQRRSDARWTAVEAVIAQLRSMQCDVADVERQRVSHFVQVRVPRRLRRILAGSVGPMPVRMPVLYRLPRVDKLIVLRVVLHLRVLHVVPPTLVRSGRERLANGEIDAL